MADKSEASWADTSSCFASGRASSAPSAPVPRTNRKMPPSSSAKCFVISRGKVRSPTLQAADGSLMQLLDLRHRFLRQMNELSPGGFADLRNQRRKVLL